MKNLFNSENYPDAFPSELTAGARWAWKSPEVTAAYPTDAYTLKYNIVQLASPAGEWTFTAGKVDSSHVVEESDTGDFIAGDYRWQAVVVRDSDLAEVVVDSGDLYIQPDFSNSPEKSWVYQVYTAIRSAVLEGAGSGQRRVEIAGRVIEWRSYAELVGLEKEFSRRWSDEKAERDRKAGRKTGGRVLIKMSA